MSDIVSSFPLKGVTVEPPLTGRLKIDDKLIQTIAALTGWDGEARRLLACALNGSLNVTSPPATAITNTIAVGDADDITYSDTPTTEIIVMADKSNGGDIWVNIGAAAAVNTGWPLDAGDIVNISINNLSELNLHIVSDTDRAIILRTV